MRLFRKRRPFVLQAPEVIRGLSVRQQREIALQLVRIVEPLGSIGAAPGLTSDAFRGYVDKLRDAVDDPASLQQLRHLLSQLDAMHAEEEPDGLDFFAFGAVVTLLYTTESLLGDPDAAAQAAMRTMEVLGAVDDELAEGLFDDGVEWIRQATRGASPEVEWLVDRVVAAAHALVDLGDDLSR